MIHLHYHRCNIDYQSKNTVPQVVSSLRELQFNYFKGCSSQIRRSIADLLLPLGWSSKVRLSNVSQISITAMNGSCALCIQTGNASRVYADLLKLQYLFNKGSISEAVYILPMGKIAKVIGQNVASFERMVKEIEIFSDIVTIPLTIIGLD